MPDVPGFADRTEFGVCGRDRAPVGGLSAADLGDLGGVPDDPGFANRAEFGVCGRDRAPEDGLPAADRGDFEGLSDDPGFADRAEFGVCGRDRAPEDGLPAADRGDFEGLSDDPGFANRADLGDFGGFADRADDLGESSRARPRSADEDRVRDGPLDGRDGSSSSERFREAPVEPLPRRLAVRSDAFGPRPDRRSAPAPEPSARVAFRLPFPVDAFLRPGTGVFVLPAPGRAGSDALCSGSIHCSQVSGRE